MAPTHGTIRLMLADVDGTLVTQEKVLTERTIAAVHKLYRRGHPLRHHQRAPSPRDVHAHRTP